MCPSRTFWACAGKQAIRTWCLSLLPPPRLPLPGAGMSVMAASEANLQYMQKLMGVQMISYDKVNQLRQVLYLQDKEHTLRLWLSMGAF